jgi:hypothetical protein
MLKIPAYRYFPDMRVTAYQDDTMWWKFYTIPDYVSIRRDKKGDPVFLLIKYAFSDEDRQRQADLPRGGGFLVFDVEMTAAETDMAKVTAVLQADVNDTWHQLKALADAGGQAVEGYGLNSWYYLNGHGDVNNPIQTSLSVSDLQLGLGDSGPAAPPGDKPPTVVMGMPTWTEGTFEISAPQSTALVSHRVTSGKVSLVGNNVASANMDLTEAGATFMQKTLVNPDGAGGTDLTPIQVTYNLKYLARVPPVHVKATADARSLYESVHSIYHNQTTNDNGCDDDTFTTTQAETSMSMAVSSGVVKIQVDAGMLPLTDSFLQDMTSTATKFVMDGIKSQFFDKKPAPAPDPADDPTKDFVNSSDEIYYLKQQIDFTSVNLGFDETITGMQPWPANPQGTLQSFFVGMDANKMKQFVRVVDLEDPFFETLGLTVTAFANWDDQIAFIDCEVRYSGQDDNGQPQDKVQGFTFTKDHTSDVWDPHLINGKREYQYHWRVGYAGRDPGPWGQWITETNPKLNLAIGEPGKVDVKVVVGNVDFTQVTSAVQVDLDYADTDAGVADQGTTVILNPAQQSQEYSRWIYVAQAKPLRYRTHFFLKNGQTIDGDWQETTSDALAIDEPSLIQKLGVNLFPAGDWSNVVQTVVDLRYSDPANQYFLNGTYDLKTVDQFLHWMVVLKDPAKRDFDFKYVTTFKDGSPPLMVDWSTVHGDGSVPINVKANPTTLAVRLLPQAVDFTVTPVVQANLHYDDQAANLHMTESFVFTKPEQQTWTVQIKDPNKRSYRYQLSYTTKQSQITEAERTTDSDTLVFPPPEVPQVTCLVIPRMIDFAVTPAVEVDVEYHDPVQKIDFTDTLIFTDAKAQGFTVLVEPSSPRTYQVGITYYLPDGNMSVKEPVTLDKNQILIPKYVASASSAPTN